MTGISERALFHAHRNTDPVVVDVVTRSAARSEDCACGLVIRVDVDAPQFVLRAVQDHQRNPTHRLWRMQFEAQESRPAQPTAHIVSRLRDVSGDRGGRLSAAQRGASER